MKMKKILCALMVFLVLMPACSLASTAPASGEYHTVDNIKNAFIESYRSLLALGTSKNADRNAAEKLFPFGPAEKLEEGYFIRSVQTENGNFVFGVFTQEDSDNVEGVSAFLFNKTENQTEIENATAMFSAVFCALCTTEEETEPLKKGFVIFAEMVEKARESENGTTTYFNGPYMFSLTEMGTSLMFMAIRVGGEAQ